MGKYKPTDPEAYHKPTEEECIRGSSYGEAAVEITVNGERAYGWYFSEHEYRYQNLLCHENKDIAGASAEDAIIDNIVDCLQHRGARHDLRDKLRWAGNTPPNDYVKNKIKPKKHNG